MEPVVRQLRLSDIPRQRRATSATYQNLSYTYDPVGNIKTIGDTVWTGSRSFDYDDLNRLVQASGTFGGTTQTQVSQSYTYDAIGNILTKAGVTYCYGYMAGCSDSNGLSRVKSTFDEVTTSNYSYDLNGNVLTSAGRTFTWNTDNRMDVVNATSGSAVMSYDYTGIRAKKSGTTGTVYYPFTGYEVQGSQVTKSIKLGNEIIASKVGANRFFYHNDHLGGVNIVSDAGGGQVQANEYDPWGKVVKSVGNTDPSHRFTGQELDPESGIHYYGGRYYDQNIGRFISPDPFIQDPDDPQNLNRYSYVLNNPQGYIDPSGYLLDDFEDCCDTSLTRSAYGRTLWNNIQSTYNQITSFAGSATGWSSSWTTPSLVDGMSNRLGNISAGLPSFDRVLGTASNVFAGAGDFFSGGFMNLGNFNEKVLGHRAISLSEAARMSSPIEGTNQIVDQNSTGYAVGRSAALSVSVATIWSAGLYAGGNAAIYTPLSAASRAQAAGRTVIENTPIGGLLQHLSTTYKIVPRFVWYAASGTYALNTLGRVSAFVPSSVGSYANIIQFEMWLLRLRNVPIDKVTQ